MRPVKPINPIRPVRGIRAITLRRVPSFKQLRMWLVFARQKAKDGDKDGPKRQPGSGQADTAPPEVPADWESEAEKHVPGQGHVDKLA